MSEPNEVFHFLGAGLGDFDLGPKSLRIGFEVPEQTRVSVMRDGAFVGAGRLGA